MYKRSKTVYENEKIIEGFNKEEKELLFSDLMDMYFKKNFGTMSKSDLETYLFSFYIEHLLDNGIDFDDYSIGRDLGITLSRVRALKERKELKYPREGYDWKTEFLHYAQNAKYDENTRLVKFSIPDVNVIKDARNFFEKNNHYDEYQLNPRLFQCSLEAFEEIGKILSKEAGESCSITVKDEKKLKKIIGKYKLESSSIAKITSGAVEDGIKDLLLTGTKEIIKEIIKELVPGGPLISLTYGAITKMMSNS